MKNYKAKNINIKQKSQDGLLYLLLGIDGSILYIGSSKHLSNKRLLQSNRMRGPYNPNHPTANTIGHEYGKSIFYAVKFTVSDYHNFEMHLIYKLKPEYNIIGKKNYLSKWDNPNYSLSNPPFSVANFINDICINGKFNTSCTHEYELLHITDVMRKNMINSTCTNSLGEVA